MAGGGLEGLALLHQIVLRVERSWGDRSVYGRFAFAQATFSSPQLDITHRELGLRLGLAREWQRGPVALQLGFGLELSPAHQQVDREAASQIKRVFGITEPHRWGLVAGGGVQAGAALWLTDRLSAWCSLSLFALGVTYPDQTRVVVRPQVTIGLAHRL